MKQKLIYLTLLFALTQFSLNGQENLSTTHDELEKLYGRLTDNFNDTIRARVYDSIKVLVDNYVKYDNIFSHKFDDLKYLGQVTSPDSAIKIVTWNIVFANRPGKYYCYIIKKGKEGRNSNIYNLKADYSASPLRTDTTYSLSDWYGALYYDLKPYVISKKQYWILLGIDYGNPLISKKIIEVLSFKNDDSLLFGKKWFHSDDKLKYREVFEYGSTGIMSLRFASDKSIVFDHLVPFASSPNGDRQFFGSDFSFDAYNLENGLWQLYNNVETRNKENMH